MSNVTSTPAQRIRTAYKASLLTKDNQAWADFVALRDSFTELTVDEIKEIMISLYEAYVRLERIRDNSVSIKAYAYHVGYTDRTAYEVIETVNPKMVKVRVMKAEIVSQPKAFTPGGFVGHYSDNHAQEWNCTPDPDGHVLTLRLGKKGWKGSIGMFRMSPAPVHFYDFNF